MTTIFPPSIRPDSSRPRSPSPDFDLPLIDTAKLEHVEIEKETYFVIRNVDAMPPFLMTLVSDTDLWAFVGSNSALTAGRSDPDHAMFPYQTVDKLLAHPGGAGARSIFHTEIQGQRATWEPWNGDCGSATERNLYKHLLGSSVIFEETRYDLGLRFRWSLELSDRYGLVRRCHLTNLAATPIHIRYLDGFHQLLPAGVDELLFNRYSYLVSAYMRHERAGDLGIFTLNSRVTDRAEPCESLSASCAWSIGHTSPTVLLSNRQVSAFRAGLDVNPENDVRGEFGAWLVVDKIDLAAGEERSWICAVDTSLDQTAVKSLLAQTENVEVLTERLDEDLSDGKRRLKSRIAASDGLQMTASPVLDAHHFANTAFNCMRGGIPDSGYSFPKFDFTKFLRSRNRSLEKSNAEWLEKLPERLHILELQQWVRETNDPQLIRLSGEYLPLLFSRRHGDPSRPWNRFSIRLRDSQGLPIFGYQGNWRDIFQNWESMARSFPGWLPNMIAVFLNASTADGYNPYRITRDGFEWEELDPEDPWSQIGYWGDHQIVYLSRLLELLECFSPGQLSRRLADREFASAVVPYEILGFEEILRDPRHSIRFDSTLHHTLTRSAEAIGNDGKLVMDSDGTPFLFSLAEKLLVPVLAKLSNFVPGGGIWLNTQRPEWNDANNALAGWGLSVVTIFHLHRHLILLGKIFTGSKKSFLLSEPTVRLLSDLTTIFRECPLEPDTWELSIVLRRLGMAGAAHRQATYQRDVPVLKSCEPEQVRAFLDLALTAVKATLDTNIREDGLVHSYNLMSIDDGGILISRLDLMLEGQAAAIGSATLESSQIIKLLQSLRESSLYRADQHSYLLQPDRMVQSFLTKNVIPRSLFERSKLLQRLLNEDDRTLVLGSVGGGLHFHSDFRNSTDLEARLDEVASRPGYVLDVQNDRELVMEIWEAVFQHQGFTGRSGAMFGFEGLGSIYWHMVAKLLFAVQEAHDHCPNTSQRAQLAERYADLRDGLGFRKSPDVYGAFPTDPYSHTPSHHGAQQPGMTGQVKEEILTRFGELGVRVEVGCLSFKPLLLGVEEFCMHPSVFHAFDPGGDPLEIPTPANSLAFTICQVPVIYTVSEKEFVIVNWADGTSEEITGTRLPPEMSSEIFNRSERIRSLFVGVNLI